MRDKGSFSSDRYVTAAKEAKAAGSATHRGEQRAREGRGLDPLVDPKGFKGIRQALNLLVPDDDGFVLSAGAAMPVKTDLDTTGSMGGNVEIAFTALPKALHLFAQGPGAVLKRYHVQIATGLVQDVSDQFPYEVSQFEPDNEIDRQMSLLVPNKGGGDSIEDYQLGLFSTARLTETSINAYGLKGYYFAVGDERGRDEVRPSLLKQIFGEEPINLKSSQPTQEVGRELLERWHGFFLQVGDSSHTTDWWSRVFAKERVVILPQTEDLVLVQAAIIGLTEGVLDLQSVEDFLRTEGKATKAKANQIVRAVAHIPIGEQAKLPNFDRIPLAGARFASRDDIWPIGEAPVKTESGGKKKAGKPAGPNGAGIKWEL